MLILRFAQNDRHGIEGQGAISASNGMTGLRIHTSSGACPCNDWLQDWCWAKTLLFRFHAQGALGVLFDYLAVEEHRVVFDAEPGFDEVVVVFAGRVAGLAGVVDGE